MDRQTFLHNLHASGLLADEQIREADQRLLNASLESFAASLVDEGMLTSFQLKRIWAGQTEGLVLGQYFLLDELGRGGYGCVYKARHNLMNRVVALKVITPELVEDDRARTWFRREVLAATQLNHPNIVLAYDADEVDGNLFFAMEFIDGPNLEQLVRKQGPLPIGIACEMIHQAAKALQYAHDKGMVHRDIKPANLLVPRGAVAEFEGCDGQECPSYPNSRAWLSGARPVLVKVVDFGLARLCGKATADTLQLHNDRSFVGTPDYVSPEQARNIHGVDIRSDLYSLGCTFYFALAAKRPFAGKTPLEIIVQHLEREPQPLEKYRPEIPPALASIVRRLMAKKPEKRFQTPAELLGELGFFYGSEGVRPQNAMTPIPPQSQAVKSAESVALTPRMADTAARNVQATNNRNEILSPTVLVEEVGGTLASTDLPLGSHKPGSSATNPIPAGGLAIAHIEGEPAWAISQMSEEQAGTVSCHSVVLAPRAADERERRAERHRGAFPTAVNLADGAPAAPILEVNLALSQSWRQWTSLIEALVGEGQPQIGEAHYRQLHRQLLDECRAHATRAAEANRAFFERMEAIVEPWLTLQSLAAMDRETLSSVLERCRQIDGGLGCAKSNYSSRAAILICLVFASVIGCLWMLASGKLSDVPSAGALWRFLQTHPILSMAVILPLVVMASISMFSRLFRS